MNKIISLVLLIAGIALVIYGISASNSVASNVSDFFTGLPTDKAMWMLIGGAILALIGLTGMLRGPKKG